MVAIELGAISHIDAIINHHVSPFWLVSLIPRIRVRENREEQVLLDIEIGISLLVEPALVFASLHRLLQRVLLVVCLDKKCGLAVEWWQFEDEVSAVSGLLHSPAGDSVLYKLCLNKHFLFQVPMVDTEISLLYLQCGIIVRNRGLSLGSIVNSLGIGLVNRVVGALPHHIYSSLGHGILGTAYGLVGNTLVAVETLNVIDVKNVHSQHLVYRTLVSKCMLRRVAQHGHTLIASPSLHHKQQVEVVLARRLG